MKVYFSHGKESGPWGSKIQHLAEVARALGCTVDSIDYTDLPDAEQRVARLVAQVSADGETGGVILVGSSMGGYVALAAAAQIRPQAVFLLAPALYMPGYARQTYACDGIPVAIVHGWADDVIPAEHSIRFARQADCSLHLISGDHRLNSSLATVTRLFRGFLTDYLPAQ